jgi:signal peptidase I
MKIVQNSGLKAVLDLWSQTEALHSIPITGRSMLPLIKNGDHVLVVHGCADVRCGDVVVFRYEDKLIAHRVLQIYKDIAGHHTFITKGDNAPRCDPPLSSSEIVGRVLSIRRGGKEMSLDTPFWRMLGWLTALSTLVWTKLFSWRSKTKHKLLGSHFNYLATLQRRGLHVFFFYVRKILFVTLCKWKS